MIPILLKGLEDLSIYSEPSLLGCIEANISLLPEFQRHLLGNGDKSLLRGAVARQEIINRWLNCVLESSAWNTVRYVERGNTGFYKQDSETHNDYGAKRRMRVFL